MPVGYIVLEEKSVDPDQLASTSFFKRVCRLSYVMHTLRLIGRIQ